MDIDADVFKFLPAIAEDSGAPLDSLVRVHAFRFRSREGGDAVTLEVEDRGPYCSPLLRYVASFVGSDGRRHGGWPAAESVQAALKNLPLYRVTREEATAMA